MEAQEDGILGKILVRYIFQLHVPLTFITQVADGAKNIPVGKVIAFLAEEGDDLSKLVAPKEETTRTAETEESHTPEPTQPIQPSPSHDILIQHSKPLFPSVFRLLVENGIENTDKIKGTGVRGMLTKGDVLAFLGKASSPTGTYKEKRQELPTPKKVEELKVSWVLLVSQIILLILYLGA